MLIVGHRGAAGLKPENTLEALRTGFESGADMLEFDVRITADGVPVLMHDSSLLRTNGLRHTIRASTLHELRIVTEGTDKPIATLEQVMDELFGKVMLNIEFKQHGNVDALIAVLQKYCHSREDWEKVVVSSFYTKELARIRKACPYVGIWLLHGRNPFIFVAFARRLNLSGVGFNRMYLNDFALEIAHKTNLFTYVYTVYRLGEMKNLADHGIDGLVTDFPDRFVKVVASTQD
jgi:glycerophosphoryl diester phosphodiesterase